MEETAWDSLIDYSVANLTAALNAGPFSDVPSDFYWTATEVAGSAETAWVMDFFIPGQVASANKGIDLPTANGRAWCARGGQDAH